MNNLSDQVIDYLIEDQCTDTCGRCVNYIPFTEEDERRYGGSENIITCRAKGTTACGRPATELCREGMKEWFRLHAEG